MAGIAAHRPQPAARPAATGRPVPAAQPTRDLPPISSHQGALDGIRAIAALAVLVIHVGGQTGFAYTGSPASWVVSRGDIGVPIFFALSGLLLFRPWAAAVLLGRGGPKAGPFLWRRALRILPIYWVAVLIALPTLNAAHARAPSAWAQYLLLAQIYNRHPWWQGTGATGLAQVWTLSVEVSFYLALPLIAAVLGWRARRAGPDVNLRAKRLLTGITWLAVSSYAFVIVVFYPSRQYWLGDTLPRMSTWFAAGMAIAVLAVWAHAEPGHDGPVSRFCRTVGFSSGACWLLAALVFAIACTPITGSEVIGIPDVWGTEMKTALYTVVASVIVASAAFQPPGPTRLNSLLGNRPMRFLGKISYGVFLWQFLVIYAFFDVTRLKDVYHGGSYNTIEVIGIFAAITLLTIAVATAGYYCVERPAQRLYRSSDRPRHGRHARRTQVPQAHVPPGDAAGPLPRRSAPHGAALARPGNRPPGRT
ncbi:MAG TPA: acyltransferase [Streptosporangiaceae bacterium]|nr:acyltransferase [Streptosporangiaceae bacterium]